MIAIMPTNPEPTPKRAPRRSAAESTTNAKTRTPRTSTKSAAAPKTATRKTAASGPARAARTPRAVRAVKPVVVEVAEAPKTPVQRSLSTEHKAALSTGREQGRVVRRYLETLERNRPKRGRRRTPDSIKRQLSSLESRLASADALTRLRLVQERRDLQLELSTKSAADDLGELEVEFAKVASEYGRRKGITYASWREAGVTAATLRKASIGRSAHS
jgi:hypothetical protein